MLDEFLRAAEDAVAALQIPAPLSLTNFLSSSFGVIALLLTSPPTNIAVSLLAR